MVHVSLSDCGAERDCTHDGHLCVAAKLIVIESGKVYGNEMSTTVNLEERDRLYAMVREAQLRGISPLATKVEKKNKRLAAEHKVTVKKQKVVELDSESDCGIIS